MIIDQNIDNTDIDNYIEGGGCRPTNHQPKGKTMADTLYKVAKTLNMRPQHLYNLARNGVIKVNEVTCELGETHKVVDQDSLDAYLTRRAEKAAKKEAAVEADLNSE